MYLNNPKILSITSVKFDEYFGFTDEEVKALLSYYGFTDCYDTVKDWYDGYRFGNKEVYCPWDVVNYVDDLRDDPAAAPRNYWSNTSSNEVVRHFIEKLDNGLTKRATGYLTQREKTDGDMFRLAIPNREIRKIFTDQIMELFKENAKKDGEALSSFCEALKNGDAENVE